MVSELDEEKWFFLKQEFLTLSIKGALQVRRCKIYEPTATEADKERFRCSLRTRLCNFEKEYKTGISCDTHVHNILRLAKEMESDEKLKGILADGRFRIGIAQKALNLYLKYLWCAGRLDSNPPPHCPFDREVLGKIGKQNENWTCLSNVEGYKSWIKEARKEADKKPLSEWELRLWNESLRKKWQS